MNPLDQYLATLPGYVGRPRDARADVEFQIERRAPSVALSGARCPSRYYRTGEPCVLAPGHRGSHVAASGGGFASCWND